MKRLLHLIPPVPPWPEAFPKELNRLLSVHGVRYDQAPEQLSSLRHFASADLLLLRQNAPPSVRFAWATLRLAGRGPLLAILGDGADFPDLPWRIQKQRAFWLRHADWFFAPGKRAARAAEKAGVPSNRLTLFQPVLPTKTSSRLPPARPGGCSSAPFVFYAGSFRKDTIAFLLLALFALKALIPSLHAALVGDGRARAEVEHFCQANPWCIHLPKPTVEQTNNLLRNIPLRLCPHPVGPEVLESFALGIPLLTIEHSRHGPEFERLIPGLNGMIAPARPGAFARLAAETLRHPETVHALSEAARMESHRYTVKHMTESFTEGILACLRIKQSP